MHIPETLPHPVTPEATPRIQEIQGQVLAARLHKNIAFFQVGIPGIEEHQVAVGRTYSEDGKVADNLDNVKFGDIVAARGSVGETETSKRRGLGQQTLFTDRLTIVTDNQMHRWPGEDVAAQLERQADHTKALLERHAVRRTIRGLLDDDGYVELETSMLQRDPSGAAARTFVTQANFNNAEYHLRIAPEIDLKLEMARTGLPKVYELGRNFRNEGASPTHHPEFTNLEMYTVGAGQAESIAMASELLARIASNLEITEPVDFEAATSADYAELFDQHLGIDVYALLGMDDEAQAAFLRSYLITNNILDPQISELHTTGMLDQMFKRVIRPKLVGATVVTGYLSRQMPLAATLADRQGIVDGFQVIIRQHEVVKAYNELTDPLQLEMNLAAQARESVEDATATDPRLIEAAKMGLPQMYGIGVGLDRFHALMTGRRIENVIPVPIK
jgi:lysyl-tRNA synthetase class 2